MPQLLKFHAGACILIVQAHGLVHLATIILMHLSLNFTTAKLAHYEMNPNRAELVIRAHVEELLN